MKTVFADTYYWIARANPNDQWANAAKDAEELLGDFRIVTTDEVLTEFLSAFSRSGETLRSAAARMAHAILNNPNVKVAPQSRDSFLKGLELYRNRKDKEYSLTDCVSMNAMKSEKLTEVLTNDRHFEQENFAILIKNKG